MKSRIFGWKRGEFSDPSYTEGRWLSLDIFYPDDAIFLDEPERDLVAEKLRWEQVLKEHKGKEDIQF